MLPRNILCWGVLVDVSGTLHIEDKIIPGAIEALDQLNNIPSVGCKLVTNTTKESHYTLLNRLHKLGFTTQEDDLFTSLSAARKFIQDRNYRPMLFLENDALKDFAGIDTSNPNCVVIGLAPSHFQYERLNDAFKLILDGAKLVAIHKARYLKRDNGFALGPGPFVQGLEYATDTKSQVVGKPETSFFLSALATISSSIPANRAFMIGDDIRDDVMGAQDAGMRGILVKTGKYREGDESKGQPWSIVNDIQEAVQLIQKTIQQEV